MYNVIHNLILFCGLFDMGEGYRGKKSRLLREDTKKVFLVVRPLGLIVVHLMFVNFVCLPFLTKVQWYKLKCFNYHGNSTFDSNITYWLIDVKSSCTCKCLCTGSARGRSPQTPRTGWNQRSIPKQKWNCHKSKKSKQKTMRRYS